MKINKDVKEVVSITYIQKQERVHCYALLLHDDQYYQVYKVLCDYNCIDSLNFNVLIIVLRETSNRKLYSLNSVGLDLLN